MGRFLGQHRPRRPAEAWFAWPLAAYWAWSAWMLAGRLIDSLIECVWQVDEMRGGVVTDLMIVLVVVVIGVVGLLTLAAVKLHGRDGKDSATAQAEDWTRGNGNTPGSGGGGFGGL